MRWLTAFALTALLALGGCSQKEKLDMTRSKDPDFIRAKLAKYTPVELKVDRSALTDQQLEVLRLLVKAAHAIDDIFWQQSYSQALAIRRELEKSTDPIDRDYLHFLRINYGPFDRQDGDKPFIGRKPKPPGAGFYPEDLTREEFETYLKKHPEQKEDLLKPNTLVRRKGGRLIAVPYEEAYRPQLEQAATYLRQAAEKTGDKLFRKYLQLRADALLSGDYFDSDMAWMDLKDNLLDIVIGPIETYEDQLMGLKAAYEGIVMVRDRQATKQVEQFVRYMNQLESQLPVPRLYKKSSVPPPAPIGVFNTVYTSGDANVAVKSIAFSLPNDERVRELKGARTVQQKNIILAKFNKILVPIARRVLDESLLPLVDGEAFFTNTLLHELAHPLGLNYVKDNPDLTVRQALKETYSPIEEAKADIVGLFNVRYFVRRGVLPRDFDQKAYATFLASIFRSVRFGATEAHARANMIEFNYLQREGAIRYNPDSGRYSIDLPRFRNAVKKLAIDLLMIEGDGNYARAKEWTEKLAMIPPEMQKLLDGLKDIPVDVEFVFDPLIAPEQQ